MNIFPIILAALLVISPVVLGANQLQLVGQFGQQAVLLINGVQRIVKLNKVSPEGIKLIRVESDYVVVLDNGRKRKVTFSTQLNTDYTEREAKKVNIWADKRGSYFTSGAINGQVVDFLVDTGATSIAMNELLARNLGIDFRYVGEPIQVSTASGYARGYRVMLDSVKVGSIQIRNVEATVLEGGFPSKVLLGMSFLKHVNLERSENLMILEYKE